MQNTWSPLQEANSFLMLMMLTVWLMVKQQHGGGFSFSWQQTLELQLAKNQQK